MEAYKVFQLGVAYTQSLLAYHTNGKPRPFSASFAVTNKCNLRCVYCNCPNLKTDELNLDQIDLLFKKLKKMGVLRLGIFGGEPMVRKDIGEIVHLAKKYDFFISLNSNLLLYDRFKDELDPVDYFFTSLDGTPEKHFANRGKHNYNTILTSIREIVKRGQKVTAICVVTEPDMDSVEYLLDLAVRENIDIHFQAECYDAEKAGRSADENMGQQEVRNFWLNLLEKKKQGAPITSSAAYLNYVSKWSDYKSTTMYDPNVSCAAGKGFLFVESSGYAYPCAYIKGQDGVEGINLLQDEWSEKFNSNTPCTKCIVGPLLEFNLLFHKPISAAMAALSKAY
ncbi:MAG: radical SAM protein [Bacteroidia bacterium]